MEKNKNTSKKLAEKLYTMDASQHTVTLPVEDYNELLQLKKEHSYMSTAIHESILRCHSGKGYREKNKNSVFDRIIEILENAKEPF